MSTYETTLNRRDEVAEGTMAFHFKKPSGFTFKPGQAIDLVLVDPLFSRRGQRSPYVLCRQRAV